MILDVEASNQVRDELLDEDMSLSMTDGVADEGVEILHGIIRE